MIDREGEVFLTDKEKEYIHFPMYQWLLKRNLEWNDMPIDHFQRPSGNLKIYKMNLFPSKHINEALKEMNQKVRENSDKNQYEVLNVSHILILPSRKQNEFTVKKIVV